MDPLAVDPAPLATVFDGPGVAVAHAASQDLDVLMAACGAVPATVFDTQIVAGFLGLSTPSLSRLVDQMLGVSLPKVDRLSDWLVRPISDRQVTYALNHVAHLLELRDVLTQRLRALGRLEWALSECDQVLETARRRASPKRRGGSSATYAACPGARERWRRKWRRGASARPPRATGPAAWCYRTSGCSCCHRGRREPSTSCAAPGASTDGTSHRGERPRSCGPFRAASNSRRTRSVCPSEGRDAPGSPGCGGRVLGRGAPDRRRPRFRPGPPRHPGRHRPTPLPRAEPARHGVAPHHRGRPAAPADRRRGRRRLRSARSPRHGGALRESRSRRLRRPTAS